MERERDIHDAIDQWHDDEGLSNDLELHEFLGLTWVEYKAWAEGRGLALDCGLYDPDRGAQ